MRILTVNFWNNLFSEETVKKVREPIIKMNKENTEIQKSMYEEVSHKLLLAPWMLKNFLLL